MTAVSDDAPDSPSARAAQRRPGVSRTIVNFWLDASLLVTFLGHCWVSAVLQFVFPVGATLKSHRVFGASILDWQNVQFGSLCVLSAGILLHVMLHWSWIMGVITTRFLRRKPVRDNGSQTLIGVGLLISILHLLAGGCLAAWMSLSAISP